MVGPNPTVNTLNGPIKGKIYRTVFEQDILAFHRIPYIKPPIGQLRFQDPHPVDNWADELDCSLEPIPSLSRNLRLGYVIEGDETAIHINAYSRNLCPAKLRPVMIWIHGGGFVSDSGSTSYFAPDYLLEKDIVLFTFNYRLSVFGFLSLDDPKLKVPGNAGLKDQTMALRWIKNNCDRFGGDSNNITVFGESAGGASVHYHCVSELSRGLFHKAIVMSGALIAPWASIVNSNFGLQLAKIFGWNESDSSEKALEILQNTPGHLLLNAVATLTIPENSYHPFLPIVEPYISDQCFISKPLTDMMADPWSKDIPMIVSSTSVEGYILKLVTNFNENAELYKNLGDFEGVVPRTLASGNPARQREFGLRLKKFYYGDGQPSLENYRPYIDIISDNWFIHPIHRMLQTSRFNSPVTYLLRFAFDSPGFNHFKTCIFGLENAEGASHADDLSYLFKNDYYHVTGGLQYGSREYKTMERMVGLFYNFAATSNPNGPETDNVTWEPLQGLTLPYKCLNISDKLELIEWPESDRVKVWDQLYLDDLV